MQVPHKLLEVLKPYFNPECPSSEQGLEIDDDGFEGMYAWHMLGLFNDTGWALNLSANDDGTYSAEIYCPEPFAQARDKDMRLLDDAESGERLKTWIASKPTEYT